jgi:hypothetical protein
MYEATFTQAKLKVNLDVVLPINESAVMNQKLTEWISKAVGVGHARKYKLLTH